jgi:glyoxylase-like metal-dependent hydrolase (beta-lactamase superfamily II)
MEQISPNLFRFVDTCHVYVVKRGDQAVLVDFGSGAVLDHLASVGICRVTDILMTHHHRDQGQGLARAVAEGIRIWAPHMEQDFFHSAAERWQARALRNNYDVRQDRFSLLEAVPLAGTLQDYTRRPFGGHDWMVLPTPGHTPGSITLLAEVDGQRAAFTGDLIAWPGKVWSLAALQWSYHGMEGAAYSILSLRGLLNHAPDVLLPSHGEPMDNPAEAVELLERRLWRMQQARQENRPLMEFLRQPYKEITPHLLLNRTSIANSYVLLSESGKALLIDYGYDFIPDFLFHPDRAAHRPWLYSLDALKRDYGVQKIDVVVPTHYHDDHVAGFNLLRDVEGTQVWAAETFAAVLERPQDYDLPCLWYDPIPVDRVVALEQEVSWEEYHLKLYPLSGHTRYAVAVGFEVDGKRVLATGDQYKGEGGFGWNYIYQNRFETDDYARSAALYARVAPDLILPGHWPPFWVEPGYFDCLQERGALLAELHRDLLPLDPFDFGGEGAAARIQPYHWQGRAGQVIEYTVEVRNPLAAEAWLQAELVLPGGWHSANPCQQVRLAGGESAQLSYAVTPPDGLSGRRFRLAVDLTAGSMRLGQQAEALVDLTQPGEAHSV